ncbi:MAG: GDSL-type esterase/lipase family protein [Cyanobacteria bacterium P01_A01_bin.84]
MRDFYLLVVGLLSGLVIPVSAVSQLINTGTDDVQVNTRQDLQQIANAKSVPNIKEGDEKFRNNKELFIPAKSFVYPNPSKSYIPRRVISGHRLYYQRLAALKSGKIYTRWDNNNGYRQYSGIATIKKKRKLTYEDWKRLLFLEGQAMARGQGVNQLNVMVGDSLSMWFPTERLSSKKLWLNQGISGDTSKGILRRLSAFSGTKPDVIYVMVGINDLRKGIKPDVILRNQRGIIRKLKRTHPRSTIIVKSILPTRLTTISNNTIRHINNQLAKISKQEGVRYLNMYTWFADFEDKLKKDLTTDGLHLSENGYVVWQSIIQQVESQLTASKNQR